MAGTASVQFELRQLRCFVAAAEELHFGRAAARMNMTQPPLSRQIQLLERVLGVKLLDRTSRAVKLTPAGRVFLLEARRILRLTESAALTTRRIAPARPAPSPWVHRRSGYSFLPRLLLQRAARAPNMDIALKEMVSAEQVESLLTGRIDVGLLRPPIDAQRIHHPEGRQRSLVAALPLGDPRLAEASLTLKDFDRQPLIMYAAGRGTLFPRHAGRIVRGKVLRPSPSSRCRRSFRAGAGAGGIGAALVPEAAMSLHFDDVHFRPVSPAGRSRWSFTPPGAATMTIRRWQAFWTCCGPSERGPGRDCSSARSRQN